jgi:hypothetical protein
MCVSTLYPFFKRHYLIIFQSIDVKRVGNAGFTVKTVRYTAFNRYDVKRLRSRPIWVKKLYPIPTTCKYAASLLLEITAYLLVV